MPMEWPMTLRPSFPWRNWTVSTDRLKLLQQRATMARLVAHPQASDKTRSLAKAAIDKADVVLGLSAAQARKTAQPSRGG